MGKYVVITTDNDRRGVFGGRLESWDPDKKIVILTEARMAVYWCTDCRGVLGLAAIGPQDGSRISPPVPRIELDGVTAVMDCTNEAIIEWEKGKWS